MVTETTHFRSAADAPDFYLFLTEDRATLRPSACRVRGTLRTHGLAERLLVVDLEPPMPAGLCGTERDAARVLLAPRRRDRPLESLCSGAVPVLVCLPEDGRIDLSAPGLLPRQLRSLEWGHIRLESRA